MILNVHVEMMLGVNGLEHGGWEQWRGEGCVVPNDAN